MSVALLFGTSAAYHRGSWSPRARAVMERLDHSMIFVLIAGTYTPFALLLLRGAGGGGRSSAVVWAGALAGIVPRNARAAARSLALHAALPRRSAGWRCPCCPTSCARAGSSCWCCWSPAALFYSAGAVVYARRRPDPSPRWFGFHEVFHALTLLAFVAHYIAVSVATYRYPGA